MQVDFILVRVFFIALDGFGETIKSMQGGHLQGGRRIPVKAMSVGMRCKSASKGKTRA